MANGENAGWRIIGLVNTPEGQRIKLIRKDSIGAYVWDTSTSNINSGWGVNEWSQADIKTLLNNGAYYNRTTGTCYTGVNNASSSCDFTSIGLTAKAKGIIDTVTWNTGAANDSNSILIKDFYNLERSSRNGKKCTSGTVYCSDNVTRTVSWKGQVGLMYPSDYGYATSGGSITNRETCLLTALHSWGTDSVSDCTNNNWLFTGHTQLSLTPMQSDTLATYTAFLYYNGVVRIGSANNSNEEVHPVVYLKTNVKISGGTGTLTNPYVIIEE